MTIALTGTVAVTGDKWQDTAGTDEVGMCARCVNSTAAEREMWRADSEAVTSALSTALHSQQGVHGHNRPMSERRLVQGFAVSSVDKLQWRLVDG